MILKAIHTGVGFGSGTDTRHELHFREIHAHCICTLVYMRKINSARNWGLKRWRVFAGREHIFRTQPPP